MGMGGQIALNQKDRCQLRQMAEGIIVERDVGVGFACRSSERSCTDTKEPHTRLPGSDVAHHVPCLKLVLTSWASLHIRTCEHP